MNIHSIKRSILSLPTSRKLVGLGSLLMIISLVLPWYQDVDNFKTGDMFLGLTGPLYAVGYSMLSLSVINIVLLTLEAKKKDQVLFGLKSSSAYFYAGISCFYLLLVTNTVYFHPKFGINITLKQSDFGMFAAFIAGAFITIGGYLSNRPVLALVKEKNIAEVKTEEKKVESVINIDNVMERKARQPITKSIQVNQPVTQPITQQDRQPINQVKDSNKKTSIPTDRFYRSSPDVKAVLNNQYNE